MIKIKSIITKLFGVVRNEPNTIHEWVVLFAFCLIFGGILGTIIALGIIYPIFGAGIFLTILIYSSWKVVTNDD
jgi:hypothetical protein